MQIWKIFRAKQSEYIHFLYFYALQHVFGQYSQTSLSQLCHASKSEIMGKLAMKESVENTHTNSKNMTKINLLNLTK